MAINGWMDKEIAVYPYNGILSSHNKEWCTDSCYDVDELQNHYTEWKKPDTKGHMLYDPIYMKCPEQANPQRQKIDTWLPEAEGVGMGSDF